MTVHATHVSSSSSQDEEVCDFLQDDFWSIFVDMIMHVNRLLPWNNTRNKKKE